MTTQSVAEQFSIYGPAFEADRYAIYDELRQTAPVFWHEETRSWFITGYDDVARLLVGDTFITSPLIAHKMVNVDAADQSSFADIVNTISTWMIYNDRPVHTRLRKHMNRAFWASELEQIRPEIGRIVSERLAASTAAVTGEFDLVTEVAHPIPALVLCQMLGISGDDVERFIGWSDDIAAFMQDFVVSPEPSVEISDATSRTMREIRAYLTEAITERRRHPRNDLLTRLISDDPGSDGGLTDEELMTQVIHLIFGGHKIPQFLLSNCLNLLFANPQVLHAVRADLSLVGEVVEEAMRVESPIQYITRHVAQDMELHGEVLRANDSVYFFLGAAGRDPRVFDDPAEFRLNRQGKRALSFGGGYHACIAGAFARMEVEEILRQVLTDLPRLRPLYDPANPQWTPNPTFHGILTMPVQAS